MSESLVTYKPGYISCRPSYRKSNSFQIMGKSKNKLNENGSSHTSTSLHNFDRSTENDDNDNLVDFNTNKITLASTSLPPKAKSVSGYPHEELLRISNDYLERSWSDKINPSPSFKNEKPSTPPHESSNLPSSSIQKICSLTLTTSLIWLGMIFVVIGIPLYSSLEERTNVNINDLKEKFPSQPNETWLYFETIIDDILFINPTHPAVFLLLYKEENKQINNLVHHLAKYASGKLNTNDDYIYVEKEEFHSMEAVKDYGFLIDKYEHDLIIKKVMVVEDLQEIPGKVAQAFHTLCDEITPLVEKVVYIFTMKVDSLHGKEENIAETNLKRFWKDLDNDILMPLITRVTSTVLKIVN